MDTCPKCSGTRLEQQPGNAPYVVDCMDCDIGFTLEGQPNPKDIRRHEV